jgi:hypothetical protein
VFGYFTGRGNGDKQEPLRKLQELLAAARLAPDAAALDQLERDANATFDAVYAHGIKNELPASALTSFDVGLSELHRSIAARRAALAAG